MAQKTREIRHSIGLCVFVVSILLFLMALVFVPTNNRAERKRGVATTITQSIPDSLRKKLNQLGVQVDEMLGTLESQEKKKKGDPEVRIANLRQQLSRLQKAVKAAQKELAQIPQISQQVLEGPKALDPTFNPALKPKAKTKTQPQS